ncbi:Hpt domain-containing protein, partial [Haemophilus influenzae]
LQQFFADESESIIEINDDNELSEQFDLVLIETLGKPQILENLSLFKQMMPNYLVQLSKDNMKETEDTAHKIKGAAASVGLNHLRQLADTLESAAKNSDIFNCAELIDEIGNLWLEDVEDLLKFCEC